MVCYFIFSYRLCIREKSVSTLPLCARLARRNGPAECGRCPLLMGQEIRKLCTFSLFNVFLEMTEIAKTFGIIRNTF